MTTAHTSHFSKSTEAATADITRTETGLKEIVSLLAEAVQALGGRIALLVPGEVVMSDIYGLRVFSVYAVSTGKTGLLLHGAAGETVNPLGELVSVYTLPWLAKHIDATGIVPPATV